MKKKATVVWIVLLWVLCALPVCALAAESVSYVERSYVSASNQVVQNTKTVTDYTVITPSTTNWSGWMVAQGDVTINERVTTLYDTYLILTDGAKLTVNGGIGVIDAGTLTIFGQSGDSGVLVADASNSGFDQVAGIGFHNEYSGAVVIHGGTIRALGAHIRGFASSGSGIGGSHSTPGTVTIYGGNIHAVTYGLCAAIGGTLHENADTTVEIHGGVIKTEVYSEGAIHIGGSGGSDIQTTITGGLFNFMDTDIPGSDSDAYHPLIDGAYKAIGGAFNIPPSSEVRTVLDKDAYGGSLLVTYQNSEVGEDTSYPVIAPGTRLNVLPSGYDPQKPLVGLYLLEEGDPLPVENFAVDSAFAPVMAGAAGYDFTMPDSDATLYAVFDPQSVSIPDTFTVQQAEAGSAENILRMIRRDLAMREVYLEAKALESLTIIPAEHGDKNNPQGKAGSFDCTVVLTNGTHEGRKHVTGTIMAQPYISADLIRTQVLPFGRESITGDLFRYGYTVSDVTTRMQEAMAVKGVLQEDTLLQDMYAEWSIDGAEWTRMPSAYATSQGVTFTQTLPAGVRNSTHNVFVLHMYSETFGIHEAGDLEWMPVNVVADDVISFTLRDFSPVMIGWVEKEPLPPPAQPPQTGDDSQLGLWLALMGASLVGMSALLLRRKRKFN